MVGREVLQCHGVYIVALRRNSEGGWSCLQFELDHAHIDGGDGVVGYRRDGDPKD
jgi:hypothetical protein